MKKIAILPFFIWMVAACAPSPKPVVPVNSKTAMEKHIEVSLNANSAKIQKLLVELSESEKAVKPISDEEMNQLSYTVSTKWDGPLEPVVRSVAQAVGMGVRVVGTPITPVLVDIDVHDEMVLEVLRNLGMQSGKLARIVYLPESNFIEIVYAKSI